MGRSSKIRHRRRRRQARALHACVLEMERALSESLGAFARPSAPSKDGYVVVDPCAPLPGLGREG